MANDQLPDFTRIKASFQGLSNTLGMLETDFQNLHEEYGEFALDLDDAVRSIDTMWREFRSMERIVEV
jgi:hypothetical protein